MKSNTASEKGNDRPQPTPQSWSAGTIASAGLTAILAFHFIQSVGMLIRAAAGVSTSEVISVLFNTWGFVMLWYLAELVLMVLGVFAVWAGVQQKPIARLAQRVFLIISITGVVIVVAISIFALTHITGWG